jgi:hypothetical protein
VYEDLPGIKEESRAMNPELEFTSGFGTQLHTAIQ